LILGITGPIASGKSTLARAVARELRRRGQSAAVVDLDLVYEMLADDPKNDAEVWSRAQSVARAVAAVLPVEIVIIEGAPLDAVEPDRVIHLTTPIEEALRRVALDPTRGISRDAAFLRRHYDEHRATAEALDTSRMELADCARWVVDAL
jgi:thymidylate kinase